VTRLELVKYKLFRPKRNLVTKFQHTYLRPRRDLNSQPKHLQCSAQPIELLELFLFNLEILGIEPKMTKCKFAILPIKLYPLYYIFSRYMDYSNTFYTPSHIRIMYKLYSFFLSEKRFERLR
jgi:hypothetical protein